MSKKLRLIILVILAYPFAILGASLAFMVQSFEVGWDWVFKDK